MKANAHFESVLVTGGAGFIGARLVQRLAPLAKKIAVLDNLHPQVHGPGAAPPAFPDGVQFIRESIETKDAVMEAVHAAAPTIVYHLAAETGTGQSYDEIARYCGVNITGTAYLIEALRRQQGSPCRIVLASSRAVYGEGACRTRTGQTVVAPPRLTERMSAGDFMPRTALGDPLEPIPTAETLPPAPSSIYASTKLMQEFLITQGFAATGIEPVILRFQNVYGPGQSLRNPYTGVLSIFCQQILAGKTLNIFEDGAIVRDFIYVTDVVEALVLAGSCSVPGSEPINIGSGRAETIVNVARTLLALLGGDPQRYAITGAFREGDIRYAVADISAARERLGWSPRVELPDGLRHLTDWARAELAPAPV